MAVVRGGTIMMRTGSTSSSGRSSVIMIDTTSRREKHLRLDTTGLAPASWENNGINSIIMVVRIVNKAFHHREWEWQFASRFRR